MLLGILPCCLVLLQFGLHVLASAIGAQDVDDWPCSVSLLVKSVTFLGSLHWPVGGADLGVGGVSYVEMLILCELWAGERLALEKAHPRYLRPGRPLSVSAVPFGPGIDIWRSCRFIGALMRSLCSWPGGHGRFVPCAIGANHCRLRHIGWEKCGNGLTSRPHESASKAFLDELSQLFQYTPRSSHTLLAGSLLGGCRFLDMLLAWLLQILGPLEVVGVKVSIEEVHWVSGSGPGRKRIRLNRKTPAHLVGSSVVQSRPRVWKRLRHLGHSVVSYADCKRRRHDQHDEGCVPVQLRTGVDDSWDKRRPVSRFARLELAGSCLHA